MVQASRGAQHLCWIPQGRLPLSLLLRASNIPVEEASKVCFHSVQILSVFDGTVVGLKEKKDRSAARKGNAQAIGGSCPGAPSTSRSSGKSRGLALSDLSCYKRVVSMLMDREKPRKVISY